MPLASHGSVESEKRIREMQGLLLRPRRREALGEGAGVEGEGRHRRAAADRRIPVGGGAGVARVARGGPRGDRRPADRRGGAAVGAQVHVRAARARARRINNLDVAAAREPARRAAGGERAGGAEDAGAGERARGGAGVAHEHGGHLKDVAVLKATGFLQGAAERHDHAVAEQGRSLQEAPSSPGCSSGTRRSRAARPSTRRRSSRRPRPLVARDARALTRAARRPGGVDGRRWRARACRSRN